MKIYMDACCVNRLTDDQSQPRIQAEAEAIERILRGVREEKCSWLGSEVLTAEVERNPQIERRRENGALLSLASGSIEVNDQILDRARQLQAAGYEGFDALHLPAPKRAELTCC